VHLLGPLADPRAWYAGSDVLLLPTHYDTCSLTALESLACGTPVVTTRLNGVVELLAPAEAGVVVEAPRDEEALGVALGRVAAAWTSFHERAVKLRASLSWRRHVDRLEEILAEVASRRR
jgi:glycosyltransferase involved in cell wall biosynthesis